jgi:hypothetical protein
VGSTGTDGALDCPECGAVRALRLGVCQLCYAEVHERDGDSVGPALTDASILGRHRIQRIVGLPPTAGGASTRGYTRRVRVNAALTVLVLTSDAVASRA